MDVSHACRMRWQALPWDPELVPAQPV